jgi:hypothetical protein
VHSAAWDDRYARAEAAILGRPRILLTIQNDY